MEPKDALRIKKEILTHCAKRGNYSCVDVKLYAAQNAPKWAAALRDREFALSLALLLYREQKRYDALYSPERLLEEVLARLRENMAHQRFAAPQRLFLFRPADGTASDGEIGDSGAADA